MEEIVQVSEDDHNNSENDSSADAEDSSEENEGNPRLADALARVIRMSQKKKSKSIVLSKAKLYSDQISTKKKHDFEIEPDPNAKIKVENTEDVKQEELDVKPGKKALKILAIKVHIQCFWENIAFNL